MDLRSVEVGNLWHLTTSCSYTYLTWAWIVVGESLINGYYKKFQSFPPHRSQGEYCINYMASPSGIGNALGR